MWLKVLGAIVLGLFLYAGSALMFNNIITGTTDSAVLAKTAIPVVVGCVTVGIAAMGLFNHS